MGKLSGSGQTWPPQEVPTTTRQPRARPLFRARKRRYLPRTAAPPIPFAHRAAVGIRFGAAGTKSVRGGLRLAWPAAKRVEMNEQKKPDQSSVDPVSRAVKDNGNEKLAGAKQILKEKLMRAVMQQAIQELGEPGNVARAVMAS